MIRVEYNGEYPCMCMGTLTIYKNNEIIYSDKYCCKSTGSVGFSDDYSESYINNGELLWREEYSSDFSEEVQKAVKDKLSEFQVCCGGCL